MVPVAAYDVPAGFITLYMRAAGGKLTAFPTSRNMRHNLVTSTLLLAAASALATDGYFDHGYGVKSKGIGGAGVAFAQDSLAPAANPAGAVDVADSHQVGLTWFAPDRGVTANGTYFNGNQDGSFLIPDFGYKTTFSNGTVFDLAVFGNGGMNTGYQAPLFEAGQPPVVSNTYMDMAQLFVAPTLAWKLDGGHAVGVSLIFAGQRFKAAGFEDFGIPGAGYDTSWGGGMRVGWTWQATDTLKLGATYQSQLMMTEFDKYSGLFAEGGDFDIPSNFAVGLAWKVEPSLTWVFDIGRILYGDIASVGNLGNAPGNFGDADGPGFGWRNVTVIKTGFSWDVNPDLTLRVGYNHVTQPIPDSQVYFNQLAPGVVRHHATLGATWKWSEKTEVSFFYAHAFEETVSGSQPYPIALRMDQNSFGLSLNWKH